MFHTIPAILAPLLVAILCGEWRIRMLSLVMDPNVVNSFAHICHTLVLMDLRLFRQRTIHLMPLGDSARRFGDLAFLGPHLPTFIAQGVLATSEWGH